MRASFGLKNQHRHAVVTEDAFCGAVPGYLHLEIGMKVPGESFAQVMRDGKKVSEFENACRQRFQICHFEFD
jgi:hypothetical protein